MKPRYWLPFVFGLGAAAGLLLTWAVWHYGKTDYPYLSLVTFVGSAATWVGAAISVFAAEDARMNPPATTKAAPMSARERGW